MFVFYGGSDFIFYSTGTRNNANVRRSIRQAKYFLGVNTPKTQVLAVWWSRFCFMCCKAVFVSHTQGFTSLAYTLMAKYASSLYKNIDKPVDKLDGY